MKLLKLSSSVLAAGVVAGVLTWAGGPTIDSAIEFIKNSDQKVLNDINLTTPAQDWYDSKVDYSIVTTDDDPYAIRTGTAAKRKK